MPARVSFPSPSSTTCPLCDGPLTSPDCPRCGAAFASVEGQTLWRVDHDLSDLCRIRNDVAARLLLRAGHDLGPAAPPVLDLRDGTASDAPAGAVAPAVDPSSADPGDGRWIAPTRPGHGSTTVIGPTPTPTSAAARTASPSGAGTSPAPGPIGGGAADSTSADAAWAAPGPREPGAPSGAGVGRTTDRGGASPGWSAAEVLVATGALSLVAAVAVFAAVAWDDLAGAAKAGILLGFTALTAVLAVAARRRGLRATAEAVGLVSLALGVADVHVARVALDGSVAAATVWALGLTVLAGSAVVLGRIAGLRAVSSAGVALAFLPPVVQAGAAGPVAAAVALGASAVLAAAVDRLVPLDPVERAVLRTGTASAWCAAVVVASTDLLTRWVWSDLVEQVDVAAPVAVLVGLTAVAVVLALVGTWSTSATGALLACVPVPLLVGVLGAAAAGPASPAGVVAWLLVASVGLVVAAEVVAASDPSRPWTALAGSASLVAAGLAVVPVVVLGVVVAGVLESGVQAIDAGVSVAVSTPVVLGFDLGGQPWWAGGALLVQLVAVAVLGVAWARGPLAELGRSLAVAAGLGAVLVGAVLAETPAVVVVGGLLVVVVAAAVLAGRSDGWLAGPAASTPPPDGPTGALGGAARPGDSASFGGPGAAGGVLGAAGGVLGAVGTRTRSTRGGPVGSLGVGAALLAVVVALPSIPLVVAASVVLVGVATAIAATWCDRALPSAPGWVATAAALLVGAVLLVGVRLDVGEVGLLTAVVVAALLLAGIGPALEVAGRPIHRDVVLAVDVVAGLAFALALLLSRTVDQASVVLAIAGVVAGVSALRPSRPRLWRLSVAAAVAVTWLQLGESGVTLVEAYTLPLAAAVLVVAGWGRPVSGSWDRFGAGLALAVGPTALLAVGGDDVTRAVVAVAAGTVLLVWGAVARLQAPLAVGAVAVGAIAVRHLAPVAADLPRYLVLAVAGIVLLAVGATFEQRRRDLHRARHRFEALG